MTPGARGPGLAQGDRQAPDFQAAGGGAEAQPVGQVKAPGRSRPGDKSQGRLDVGQGNAVQVVAQAADGMAHHPPAGGGRQAAQGPAVQDDPLGGFVDPNRAVQVRGHPAQPGFLVTADGGGAVEGVHDGRVGLLGDERQEHPADPVAPVIQPSVGFVFAVVGADGFQESEDLLPVDGEQGPDEPAAAHGGHGGQAQGTGAPDQVHQDQLGVVVALVAQGDLVAVVSGGGLLQEGIAQLAPGGFQGEAAVPCLGGGIHAAARQGERQPIGESLDAAGVPVGRRTAQAMVQVGHHQSDAPGRSQAIQSRQQGHRVRAAGYRHQHPVSGRHEAVARQAAVDRRQKAADGSVFKGAVGRWWHGSARRHFCPRGRQPRSGRRSR